MRLKHLKACFCFGIMQLPMSRSSRAFFAKLGGVKVVGSHHLIGKKVSFDTVYPENIVLGDHAHITSGVTFLTHFLDTSKPGIRWKAGHIEIGEHAFIGTNSIIAKGVKIGKRSIVGAGSVVTKDIPDDEIWAGNPARFIKKRAIKNENTSCNN